MPVRTVIDHGTKDKRSVAFSLDWPGWSPGAKSAELALETLESYRVRYRPICRSRPSRMRSSPNPNSKSSSQPPRPPLWLAAIASLPTLG